MSGINDELQLENGDDAAWNDYLQQDFTVTKRLPAIRPLSTATKEQHQEHKRILPKITRQHNTSATSSANNNPVGVETIKVDDDTRSNSVGSSRHEQGLENTASEWGISDQDLAENMYRNRRRYMNFIHKPEQRQKMQGRHEREHNFSL